MHPWKEPKLRNEGVLVPDPTVPQLSKESRHFLSSAYVFPFKCKQFGRPWYYLSVLSDSVKKPLIVEFDVSVGDIFQNAILSFSPQKQKTSPVAAQTWAKGGPTIHISQRKTKEYIILQPKATMAPITASPLANSFISNLLRVVLLFQVLFTVSL